MCSVGYVADGDEHSVPCSRSNRVETSVQLNSVQYFHLECTNIVGLRSESEAWAVAMGKITRWL